jgi:hypothetical protein
MSFVAAHQMATPPHLLAPPDATVRVKLYSELISSLGSLSSSSFFAYTLDVSFYLFYTNISRKVTSSFSLIALKTVLEGDLVYHPHYR